MTDMLRATADGLFCPAGPFHIDPAGPVDLAIVTHAHADHARPGSSRYVCAVPGLPALRRRLGPDETIDGWTYGDRRRIGDVEVSLHPAGHVAGSAQVRVHDGRETWVVSGDYKRQSDPTCTPFEIVPCDTFVSEATFALPIYRWPPVEDVIADLRTWIAGNRQAGRPTVLYAYSLGKAQRVLAELGALSNETVFVHGALLPLIAAYRAAGIEMIPTAPATSATRRDYAGALIFAPPSAAGSTWMRRFGEHVTAFCSGWMQVRGNRRRRGYDRGFVISDHADWPSLLRTFAEVAPRRVLLTHGYSDALVRYLNETGTAAAALATSFGGEE